ncbi:hypothetical protein B4U79_04540 [Dinothrombium tinctorium]|uniref:Uncharacterized protein n=1 Tax=Dinothrombium tinctorium TaxID=1965070 RepID=A0A3S3QRG4_9ACAR|nr:hypothetical protein B4U79_04540 [Dinothrombium tinctorium]
MFSKRCRIEANQGRQHYNQAVHGSYQPHYPSRPLSNSSQPLHPKHPQTNHAHRPIVELPPHSPLPPSEPILPPPQIPHKPIAREAPLPPLVPEPPPGSLVAYIHSSGIMGYMLLTPGSAQTTIRYHIVGVLQTETFRWKIYTQPTLPLTTSCSPTVIGTMLTDLTETLGPLRGGRGVLQSNIDLTGDDSILGKTLILEGIESGIRICTTLLPATKKVFAEAKLHSPVAGMVRIFQTSVRTGIITEYMMYSDGRRKDSVHQWALVQGSAEDATPEARVTNEQQKCRNFVGVPLIESNSAKAKPLTVSTEMPTIKGRTYQTVQAITSFDTVPIVYLILYEEKDTKTILACAALDLIEPKKAAAKFSSNEIQGSLTFTQETPYDPTQVEVNIKLFERAYSYGIDVLPTIKRRTVETKKCPNVKETIYNPLNKDPEEVPPQGEGSSDQYAVGDLSGKYGTLENVQEENFKVIDCNLPLFGYFSVVGRAIIFYSPDGPAIGCSNINLVDTNLTTSYATFDVPFQGQFIFRQRTGRCSDDMYIYIEASKPEQQGSEKTFNHPWHVHEKQVNAGFEHLSSTDCAAAGPHLNTYNTSTACIYQRDCTLFTSLRCENGDLTGKLSAIDIPVYKLLDGGEPDVGKYYFIDNNIANCGPASIIGRSIVIHSEDFGSPRVTCANILEFKSKP